MNRATSKHKSGSKYLFTVPRIEQHSVGYPLELLDIVGWELLGERSNVSDTLAGREVGLTIPCNSSEVARSTFKQLSYQRIRAFTHHPVDAHNNSALHTEFFFSFTVRVNGVPITLTLFHSLLGGAPRLRRCRSFRACTPGQDQKSVIQNSMVPPLAK